MRLTLAAVLVTTALTITACGSSSPDASKPETPATVSQPTPTPSTTAPAPTTAVATPSPTKAATHPAPTPAALTGFAATLTEWRAHHEQAPGFNKDSSFLPLIGGKQPKYYGAMPEPDGNSTADTAPPDKMIMINYSVAMDASTSEADAVREALAEFPPDARVTKTSRGDGTCKQFMVRSKTVERQLAAFHWTNSIPFFELTRSDGGPYTAGHVDEAILGVAEGGDFYGC